MLNYGHSIRPRRTWLSVVGETIRSRASSHCVSHSCGRGCPTAGSWVKVEKSLLKNLDERSHYRKEKAELDARLFSLGDFLNNSCECLWASLCEK